jgi:hypothetical protein
MRAYSTYDNARLLDIGYWNYLISQDIPCLRRRGKNFCRRNFGKVVYPSFRWNIRCWLGAAPLVRGRREGDRVRLPRELPRLCPGSSEPGRPDFTSKAGRFDAQLVLERSGVRETSGSPGTRAPGRRGPRGLRGTSLRTLCHPGPGPEDACHQPRNVQVNVEGRPMQIEHPPIDLDTRKALCAGVLQVVHEPRRKCVGAAVDQVEDNSTRSAVVVGRDSARFGREYLAAKCLGGSQLPVSHATHGFAPTPVRKPRPVRRRLTEP